MYACITVLVHSLQAGPAQACILEVRFDDDIAKKYKYKPKAIERSKYNDEKDFKIKQGVPDGIKHVANVARVGGASEVLVDGLGRVLVELLEHLRVRERQQKNLCGDTSLKSNHMCDK